MTEQIETSDQSVSKYMGLGAAIAVKLMTGFCFGIGVISAVEVVDDFNHFFGALMSSK